METVEEALTTTPLCPFRSQWTGTYLTPLSKPVAGEIPKDREIGTNPLADSMASMSCCLLGGIKGCRNGR
jgi:hypothetical protein